MATEFNYTISTQTTNGKVAVEKLHDEISGSSISIALESISTSGDNLKIIFKVDISASEETELNSLVSSHDGEPGPKDPQPVAVQEAVAPSPFAAKTIGGKNLFTRVYGVTSNITIGTNSIDFVIPYTHVKFNALEVCNGDIGDKVSLKVLDSDTGTYTTIPNYELNQFGFDMNLPQGFYVRESQYDADLYQGMIIRMEYTAAVAKNVRINIILHELK